MIGEHPERVNYAPNGFRLRVMCPICGVGGGCTDTYQPKCHVCNASMLPASNGKIECEWDTFIKFLKTKTFQIGNLRSV